MVQHVLKTIENHPLVMSNIFPGPYVATTFACGDYDWTSFFIARYAADNVSWKLRTNFFKKLFSLHKVCTGDWEIEVFNITPIKRQKLMS